MLIASTKSRSMRGASHQPAFMSIRQTMSHSFYLPYLPSTWGVLADVPWSLMIGPMVAPLAHFLGMVWFQVYGGSQCCSKEWVWNSRTELCWKVVRKVLWVWPCYRNLYWVYDVLGKLYLRRLSGLMDSKADSCTGDPWSPPRRGDSSILILWTLCQKARGPYLHYLPSTWGVLRCSMVSYHWFNGSSVSTFFRNGMVSGLPGGVIRTRKFF